MLRKVVQVSREFILRIHNYKISLLLVFGFGILEFETHHVNPVA